MKSFKLRPAAWSLGLGSGSGLTGGGGHGRGQSQQNHQGQQFDVHAAAAGAWLSRSGRIQGQQWPQAGFLAELRLQPGTAERETHFLRREGGCVCVWGGGPSRRGGRDFLLCKRAGWESRRKSDGSSLSVFIVPTFLLIVCCFLSSLCCGLLYLGFILFPHFSFFSPCQIIF